MPRDWTLARLQCFDARLHASMVGVLLLNEALQECKLHYTDKMSRIM